jgi:hypothetical protein
VGYRRLPWVTVWLPPAYRRGTRQVEILTGGSGVSRESERASLKAFSASALKLAFFNNNISVPFEALRKSPFSSSFGFQFFCQNFASVKNIVFFRVFSGFLISAYFAYSAVNSLILGALNSLEFAV